MVIEYLIKLGYTQEEANKIRNDYIIKDYKDITLLDKISKTKEFLISMGYSEDQILKMTVSLPTIYGYSIDN